MNQSKSSPVSRRTVFAGAGAVGALAAVVAVAPRVEPAIAQAPVASADQGTEDGRYQVTAHVSRYYQTARV